MSIHYSHSHASSIAVPRSRRAARSIKMETLTVFLGAALLILSVSYIVLSNMTAASGFKLRDQQKRIEELTLQNKKSEAELAGRESISRLEEEARRIGLVPIGRVKYLGSPDETVAVK